MICKYNYASNYFAMTTTPPVFIFSKFRGLEYVQCIPNKTPLHCKTPLHPEKRMFKLKHSTVLYEKASVRKICVVQGKYSSSLLPGRLGPEVVMSVKVQCTGQKDLFKI